MPISYRAYTEEDRDQVKQLLVYLVTSIATKNSLRRKRPSAKFSEHYLNKQLLYVKEGKGIVYVAIDSGNVVGCGIGVIKDLNQEDLMEFKDIKKGFVSDLVVSQNYQKKGVGARLMQCLGKYFENEDCKYIETEVLLSNINAHALYQRLGYVANAVSMICKLDDQANI